LLSLRELSLLSLLLEDNLSPLLFI